MLEIKGYQIDELVYQSPRTITYSGTDSQGQSLIFKMINVEFPTAQDVARTKMEYNLLKSLNIDGIPKVHSLLMHNNKAIIVTDHLGMSLRKKLTLDANNRFSIEQCLATAIGIVEIIGQLHHNKVIHKDIKPSNITFKEDGTVGLVDFDIATRLSEETQQHVDLDGLDGSLPYIAPEQTGRINRPVDYRCDFYSLGATLYEALTGTPPFTETDPTKLIYAHLAIEPKPLNEVDSNIPEALSNIVLKLLSKKAEQRYISSQGLLHDLKQCQTQWQQQGKIDNFEIASKDYSNRFTVSRKVYGRDAELQQLLQAFERSTTAQATLTLVSGYSGIGKSCLIREIHQPLLASNGYLIEGKFDQYQKDTPFSCVLQALNQLIDKILSGNESELNHWRRKIRDGIGPFGQLLIDLIPELEHILGKQPAVPPLQGEENNFRLLGVLEDFINVFASIEHPLVLFLDDLQWADTSSLKIIQRLMSDDKPRALLVIGAYRNNEVNAHHPLMLTLEKIDRHIEQIELQPLDIEATNELVSDSLHMEPERSLPLSQKLHQKSQGNPFFTIELMQLLYQHKLLQFDTQSNQWQWDEQGTTALQASDNVVDLVSDKIKTLDELQRRLLAYAGQLGTVFDLNALSHLCALSASQAANHLWAAIEIGLIYPLNDNYRLFMDNEELTADANEVQYRFAHDRIYEAAHNLMAQKDIAKTHLRVGQFFKEQYQGQQEHIFEICNHLNIGQSLITEQHQKDELAELNLQAGEKAMASSAWQTAQRFLSFGIDYLGDDGWTRNYKLCFELSRARANCTYLAGDVEAAHPLFESCLEHAKPAYDKGLVYESMLSYYLVSARYPEGLQLALSALKLFDIELPEKPEQFADAIVVETEQIELLIKNKDIDSLIDLPVLDDKSMTLVHILLQQAWTTGYVTEGMVELSTLAAMRIAKLTLERGTTEYSSFGYMIYGMYLLAEKQQYKRGHEFGKLAIELQKRHQHPTLTPKLNNLFGHFINHFVNPYTDNMPLYEQSYQCSCQVGDLWWGTWAVMYQTAVLYEQGNSLEEVNEHGKKFIQYISDAGNHSILYMHRLTVELAKRFGFMATNTDLQSEDFDDQHMVETMQSLGFDLGLLWHDAYAAQWYFHRRQLDKALAITQRAEKIKHCAPGIIQYTTHEFFNALILAANYEQATPSEQVEYLEKIEQNLDALKSYAKTGPQNYLAKSFLVGAEYSRIKGDILGAIDKYDRAIDTAQQYQLPQIQGLTCELAGRFCHSLGRKRFAKTYLNEAVACYNLWGANALSTDLVEQFPDEIQEQRGQTENDIEMTVSKTLTSSTFSKAQWNIAQLLQDVRSFTNETRLNKLMSKMIQVVLENTGAQKITLILVKDNELIVEGQGAVGTEPQVMESLPLSSVELPEEIIHYVGRTSEEVVLHNACEQGMFTRSKYIRLKQCQSVACMPILNQGNLVAIAYVENNSTEGAFTEQGIEILRFLASQAAISIEHALLKAGDDQNTHEYRVGGSVDANSSFYIRRHADNELYRAIKTSEFCYVLNPRQMGKSSLRVNTMKRLQQEGHRCASIDITSIGSQQVTIEQWYAGLARSLLVGLELAREVNLRKWWRDNINISPVQRLSELIETEILTRISAPITIFIDEIDSVMSLDFNPDDFFASIRALYNKRVDDDNFKRLTFVLLGVALPYELIQDKKRTPFNIGVEIRLKGFRNVEAGALGLGLEHKTDNTNAVIKEVIAWTGGQPFLTQKVCRILAQTQSKPAKGKEKEWVSQQVLEKVIDNWEVQDQPEHLITVRTRIIRSPNSPKHLLEIYKQILIEGEITYDASPAHEELILSGAVVREWDRLVIANNIYSSVFNLEWIDKELKQLNPQPLNP